MALSSKTGKRAMHRMKRGEIGMPHRSRREGTQRTAWEMTPPGRVERRKEKTRRTLIECALGLFYEKGLHWTKVEDITERADVGKGTFYRHFATKEMLIQEILQVGFDALLARVKDTMNTGEPKGSIAQEVVRAQLDFYLQYPQYLLFFHQVRGLLQLRAQPVKELRDLYNDYLARLALIMRPMLNDTGCPPGSERDLAMAMSAFTSGLLVDHLLFDEDGIRGHRERLQDQLERSIQALA